MEIGRDQADFVADARGEDRGFGIVEYDAGLLVEPAGAFIGFRDNRRTAGCG